MNVLLKNKNFKTDAAQCVPNGQLRKVSFSVLKYHVVFVL